MEHIVIHVKDKEKAKLLLELLASLDFVDSVNTAETIEAESKKASSEQADFFSLAGLWAERDITLEAIRKKAWPRQHQ